VLQSRSNVQEPPFLCTHHLNEAGAVPPAALAVSLTERPIIRAAVSELTVTLVNGLDDDDGGGAGAGLDRLLMRNVILPTVCGVSALAPALRPHAASM
jgi:hypothetical protein